MHHQGFDPVRPERQAAGTLRVLPRPADDADDGFQRELGRRLRAVRRARGLRLQDVEAQSEGRFKAVVIGSYERGDRAVAAQRLASLAAFYDVPLDELLPNGHAARPRPAGGNGIPLALDRLGADGDPRLRPLARLVHHIQWQRGDYNGRILTLRGDDVRMLAFALGVEPDLLPAWLAERGLLATV
jgi:transcriptional regulator with XRE-family HTH domain